MLQTDDINHLLQKDAVTSFYALRLKHGKYADVATYKYKEGVNKLEQKDKLEAQNLIVNYIEEVWRCGLQTHTLGVFDPKPLKGFYDIHTSGDIYMLQTDDINRVEPTRKFCGTIREQPNTQVNNWTKKGKVAATGHRCELQRTCQGGTFYNKEFSVTNGRAERSNMKPKVKLSFGQVANSHSIRLMEVDGTDPLSRNRRDHKKSLENYWDKSEDCFHDYLTGNGVDVSAEDVASYDKGIGNLDTCPNFTLSVFNKNSPHAVGNWEGITSGSAIEDLTWYPRRQPTIAEIRRNQKVCGYVNMWTCELLETPYHIMQDSLRECNGACPSKRHYFKELMDNELFEDTEHRRTVGEALERLLKKQKKDYAGVENEATTS